MKSERPSQHTRSLARRFEVKQSPSALMRVDLFSHASECPRHLFQLGVLTGLHDKTTVCPRCTCAENGCGNAHVQVAVMFMTHGHAHGHVSVHHICALLEGPSARTLCNALWKGPLNMLILVRRGALQGLCLHHAGDWLRNPGRALCKDSLERHSERGFWTCLYCSEGPLFKVYVRTIGASASAIIWLSVHV